MKWSDTKLGQWGSHGAIGFGWACMFANIVWLGTPSIVAWVVGFSVSLVSATMKEGTDETVYQELLGLEGRHIEGDHVNAKAMCRKLDWHGWDWKDFLQHAVGGFIGATVPVVLFLIQQ